MASSEFGRLPEERMNGSVQSSSEFFNACSVANADNFGRRASHTQFMPPTIIEGQVPLPSRDLAKCQ